MTNEPISPNQILYNWINNMMDKCEHNPIKRAFFEYNYIKEDYQLDWNKRLDNNGEWKDKGDVE